MITADAEITCGASSELLFIEPSALESCSAMKEVVGPLYSLRNTGHAPVPPRDTDPARLLQPAGKKLEVGYEESALEEADHPSCRFIYLML